MRNARHLVSIASLALAACSDGTIPTAPRAAAPRPSAPTRPSASISDAVTGGTTGFYFLAPLVAQPQFSGTFDGTKQVVVLACSLGGSATVAPATSCTGALSYALPAVDVKNQTYSANLQTDRKKFPAGQYYRLKVVSYLGVEWGHVDLFLAANGSEFRNINQTQFVPLVDGRAIPVKFRIEQGAVPGGTTGGTTGSGAVDCVANPTHEDCQLT
jgi:hypothetical protein